jgi:hypothetical protein
MKRVSKREPQVQSKTQERSQKKTQFGANTSFKVKLRDAFQPSPRRGGCRRVEKTGHRPV